MAKKILLIYPPSPIMNREDRCQQPVKDLMVIPPLPPTDLLYLAAIAEQVGLEAMIKDYSLGGNLEEDLKEFKPDYLVANVATPTLKSDLECFKIAKKINPKIINIAKGAIFLTQNSEILLTNKAITYLISGEAEDVLKDLLKEELEPKDILGLWYRDGFVAKFSGVRPFIENLDELPFPARHLIDNNIYRRPDNNKVQAVIKVSRGCPHHCFFCLATPTNGNKVRMRSPENIIAEIRECINKYKITNFIFWSDIFNQDREWTMNLCQKIIDSGLKFTWSANTRADTADLKMAQFMYKAGCRLVSIGVESGSQFILDKIGKNITLNEIRDTVKAFKQAKIKIYNYFVLGLPWEDEETAGMTIDFAIELDSDFVSFYTATPLPGSRFYNYVKNELHEEISGYENAYYKPCIKTYSLSQERVLELNKIAVKAFYLRPLYILKMLLKIRSLYEIKSYFLTGLKILLSR
ncbi:MAG: B12-binding domain-containing radical SAM protein [Candidatus Gastranaerophilaceae bacterium]